jgi:hypothetical protein
MTGPPPTALPPSAPPCPHRRWVIAGAGNRLAFISEGNDPGHERAMTYHQALAATCRLVGAGASARGRGRGRGGRGKARGRGRGMEGSCGRWRRRPRGGRGPAALQALGPCAGMLAASRRPPPLPAPAHTQPGRAQRGGGPACPTLPCPDPLPPVPDPPPPIPDPPRPSPILPRPRPIGSRARVCARATPSSSTCPWWGPGPSMVAWPACLLNWAGQLSAASRGRGMRTVASACAFVPRLPTAGFFSTAAPPRPAPPRPGLRAADCHARVRARRRGPLRRVCGLQRREPRAAHRGLPVGRGRGGGRGGASGGAPGARLPHPPRTPRHSPSPPSLPPPAPPSSSPRRA